MDELLGEDPRNQTVGTQASSKNTIESPEIDLFLPFFRMLDLRSLLRFWKPLLEDPGISVGAVIADIKYLMAVHMHTMNRLIL